MMEKYKRKWARVLIHLIGLFFRMPYLKTSIISLSNFRKYPYCIALDGYDLSNINAVLIGASEVENLNTDDLVVLYLGAETKHLLKKYKKEADRVISRAEKELKRRNINSMYWKCSPISRHIYKPTNNYYGDLHFGHYIGITAAEALNKASTSIKDTAIGRFAVFGQCDYFSIDTYCLILKMTELRYKRGNISISPIYSPIGEVAMQRLNNDGRNPLLEFNSKDTPILKISSNKGNAHRINQYIESFNRTTGLTLPKVEQDFQGIYAPCFIVKKLR